LTVLGPVTIGEKEALERIKATTAPR
jgi:hypothetical protein